MRKITLSAVNIPDQARFLTNKAFDEGMVGQSEYVEKFEEMIAAYVGAHYCVAVSNGTMADAVAVAAMKYDFGIKRVVVPALTFIAQPNSVRYNNLEVIFTDVGEDWLIDMEKYFNEYLPDGETLFFFTDLMGKHPTLDPKYDPEFDMKIIEDACEAFGSKFNGRHAGTFGIMGTYSFFPSHTISTGEGGAIVTDDEELYKLCKKLRAHGAGSSSAMEKFTFPYQGFNARMTTMQACLGIALMEEIDKHVNRKRMIFKAMGAKFGGFIDGQGEEIVPHGYPINFKSETRRDACMRKILDAGIECRKFFSCIPTDEEPYIGLRKYPVADYIAHTHLYLPCHQNMTLEDVDYIAGVVLPLI